MATRQYIGARYVPKFADPVEWNGARSYEALTIVTYYGASYTSKKPVPAGVDISNTDYWVLTGNYNQQVEEYRQDVVDLDAAVDQLSEQTSDLAEGVENLAGEVENLVGYLSGKTIKIFGDSISTETATSQYQTLQPNWVAKLRERVPADCTVDNTYSLAGRFITGNQGIADVIRHLTAAELACDVLIIFAGVNDYRHSRNLYNGTDNDYSTLAGALKMIANDIRSKIPAADVFIVSPLREFANSLTPYPDTHNDNQPLILYRNLMYAWASNNGFTFVDGFSAPMLNPATGAMIDLYQKDGLHPNSTYAPLLCDYIYNKIVTHTPVHPAKESILVISPGALESGVTASAHQGVADERGHFNIHASLLCELSSGTAKTLLTLPTQFLPDVQTLTLARCSNASGISTAPVWINTNGTVTINPGTSGTTAIAIDVDYPIGYLNPKLTPSV